LTGRRIVIVLAIVAVGVAAYRSLDRSDSGDAGHNDTAIRVSFAYSPNQEKLVLPLIRRFNAGRHISGGHAVEIVGESISSGDAEAKIAAKDYRPTIWSPASSL
jgi:hypothetical protein